MECSRSKPGLEAASKNSRDFQVWILLAFVGQCWLFNFLFVDRHL